MNDERGLQDTKVDELFASMARQPAWLAFSQTYERCSGGGRPGGGGGEPVQGKDKEKGGDGAASAGEKTKNKIKSVASELKYSEKCLKGLESLGKMNPEITLTAASLTSAGSKMNVIDASSSEDEIPVMAGGEIKRAKVREFLASTNNYAIAETGGINVYWQAGWEVGVDHPLAVMHELLHNLGFTDEQLMTFAEQHPSSVNPFQINSALESLCFAL